MAAAASAVTAALLAVGATAASGKLVRETARSGVWQASFSYVVTQAVVNNYADLHLTVLKGSQIVLDQPVISAQNDYVQPGIYGGKSVSFRDLDGDGTPELLLSLYTGGAHCCSIEQVFDLRSTPPVKHEIGFGDPGARLITVGGRALFQSADDAFAYAFTDFADSGFPIQIWAYKGGRFSNVTRSYPALIVKDAAFYWKLYRSNLKTKRDVRGLLSAWAADEALLGKAAQAKQRLLQIAFSGALDWGFGGAKGSTFVRSLWRFLAKYGYLKS